MFVCVWAREGERRERREGCMTHNCTGNPNPQTGLQPIQDQREWALQMKVAAHAHTHTPTPPLNCELSELYHNCPVIKPTNLRRKIHYLPLQRARTSQTAPGLWWRDPWPPAQQSFPSHPDSTSLETTVCHRPPLLHGARSGQAGPSPATKIRAVQTHPTWALCPTFAPLSRRRPPTSSLLFTSIQCNIRNKSVNPSLPLEEATLLEPQAATQTATTTGLKFKDFFPPLLSLSFPRPPSRYENLGCAALASPLAVVVRKRVLWGGK